MVTVADAKEFPTPVFVVGVPRSGTTLLAAMLSAHSRMSCGPESDFFEQLGTQHINRLCDPRFWPRAAVDFLYSIKTLDQPLPDMYGITRKQLERYLQAQPPAVTSVLASVTEQYTKQAGKQRWVEKTPVHCNHVRTIRRYYPTSPIIRIVRDPRDVALSLKKVSWGPQSLIESVWKWRGFETLCTDFFRTDRYALTLRYEDLVRSPEAKLKEVCAFIGEQFEPGMLDTSQSIRHVNRINEVWKVKAGMPVDASRVATWKHCLTDGENRLFEAILGKHLTTYGYECRDNFKGFLQVYPAGQSRHYWHILKDFVSRGFRLWPKGPREIPSLTVYLGQPDSDGWLLGDSFTRLRMAAAMSIDLWRARVSRRRVYWFREGNRKPSGLCARLLHLSLRPFSSSAGLSELDYSSRGEDDRVDRPGGLLTSSGDTRTA